MLHIVNLKLERHLLQMELFIPVAILKIVLLELQSGDFTPPCGICRQVMEEFMADGTVVLSNGKEIKEYTVRELLPAGFSAEDMKG